MQMRNFERIWKFKRITLPKGDTTRIIIILWNLKTCQWNLKVWATLPLTRNGRNFCNIRHWLKVVKIITAKEIAQAKPLKFSDK